MKKISVLLLATLLPLLAFAESVEIDGIYYNLVSKAAVAEVTQNPDKYTGEIVIPEQVEYDGQTYSVTKISDNAFYGNSGMTSVSIPSSVITIGRDAFSSCAGLTDVTIPNSVTSLGSLAFWGCSGLTSVTLSSGLKEIGYWCFRYCRNLKSVNIPNGVETIGERAFASCESLTSIELPNSLKTIGVASLEECISLTSIHIPSSVTTIDAGAFSGCGGLTAISIPAGVTTLGSQCFKNCGNITTVEIGKAVSRIGESAFQNCQSLKDVYCYSETVPNTSANAFQDSYVEYATLHVPASALNSYKTAAVWKGFGTILAVGGTGGKKCAMPTISYLDGELIFDSSDEGAAFVSEVTVADANKYYDSRVRLTATYEVKVYATLPGYENSDVATATLCWIESEPRTEGMSNGLAAVKASTVLIQMRNGILNVQGAKDGETIVVSDISGRTVAQKVAASGQATIPLNLAHGEVFIVSIGEKSIKLVAR